MVKGDRPHDPVRAPRLHRRWGLREADGAAELAEAVGLPELQARLLAGRGVRDPALARLWVGGSLADLPDPRAMVGMDAAVERSHGSACPEVTASEAASLREGSATLRATEGLEAALERLAGLLSREVAIHELRHAQDRAAWVGEQDWEPHCEGCNELSRGGRRELSAYLASLAHGPTPVTSLFLACRQLEAEEGGIHREAVAFLDEQLGGACSEPPAELQQSARTLEARLFGGNRAVSLGDGYPGTLPVR